MLVYWVFNFDFFIVLATLVVGLGTLVWIRFVRFPPYLARVRAPAGQVSATSRATTFTRPETTIRAKSARRRRRR